MNKQAAVFVMLFVLFSGSAHSHLAQATVIGGHFWILESELKKMHGVLLTVAGYYYKTTSGTLNDSEIRTQAVRVIYNPKLISIQHLASELSQHVFPKALALGFCRKDASSVKAILAPNAVYHRGQASANASLVSTVDTMIKPLQGHFRAANEYDQDYIGEHPFQFWWYSVRCKTKLLFGLER